MILAFAYRQRGRHVDSTDTTEARLIWWVLPMLLLCTLLADAYGLPKWLGIPCGLLAWGGIAMGHSFAQNDLDLSFAEMGLVCFTRLAGMFMPFLMASFWGYPLHGIFAVMPLLFFFQTWGASALSYSTFFQSRTLRLFGVDWCVPGDSSWEEWLIGLQYDVVFWVLFLNH